MAEALSMILFSILGVILFLIVFSVIYMFKISKMLSFYLIKSSILNLFLRLINHGRSEIAL